MATPAVRALKRRFPQAEVTWLCEATFEGLLRSNPDVDSIVTLTPGAPAVLRASRSLRRGFDLALDFEGSHRTAALTLASRAPRRVGFADGPRRYAYTDRPARDPDPTTHAAVEKLWLLEPLGIDVRTASRRPVLELDGSAAEWARTTLEAARIGGKRFLITVSVGAGEVGRCWPIASYARLLESLAASYQFDVVLVPRRGFESRAAELPRLARIAMVQLDTPPSLTRLAALLARADLHIGDENAAKHIASALGTATLAFFGAGRRRRWHPPGDPLQAALEPPPESPAIGRITPEDARAAVARMETYLPRLRGARLARLRPASRSQRPAAGLGA